MTTVKRKSKQLGQILIELQMITPEQLETALDEHKRTPKSLGRVLIDMGMIKEGDLVRALAEQVGLDNFGRPVLGLVIMGTRISLLVGLTATVGAMVIGAVVGIAAGYAGGKIDTVLNFITNWFLVLPDRKSTRLNSSH